jgi:pimeloyl-ACP methyl ester carboxylesterase
MNTNQNPQDQQNVPPEPQQVSSWPGLSGPPIAAHAPTNLHRAEAAGICYLRRSGTGRPLVLLHGIGSDAETWLPLIAALPATTDVIAWDAPGYGPSIPLATATPTPTGYADALARLLDALGIEDRIALAGHSLGCLFAARFAVTYPARIATLALLSPALGYATQPGTPLPPNVQARIDDLRALGPTEFAAKRAPRLVHRPGDKPAVLAGVRRAMAAVRFPGYAQAVHALGTGTLLADAATIAAPTLVAIGAQDIITPPANADAVHAALPNPTALHLIDDAGHALPQEAPARVAELLTEHTHV